MDSLRKRLLAAYAGLALAFVLLLVLTEAAPTLLDEYGPNAVTELAGILVTVFLIDRVVRWEHERRVQPVKDVAARRLSRPIKSLVALLARMYRVATTPGTATPRTTLELLSRIVNGPEADFTRLSLTSRGPTAVRQSWGDYAASVTGGVEEVLLADMDRYAEVLSTDLVKSVHTLFEDLVFLYLKQWPGYFALSQERGESFPTSLPPLIASSLPAFSQCMSDLVAAYDDIAPPQDRLANASPD